jgi:hypothetical protein
LPVGGGGGTDSRSFLQAVSVAVLMASRRATLAITFLIVVGFTLLVMLFVIVHHPSKKPLGKK